MYFMAMCAKISKTGRTLNFLWPDQIRISPQAETYMYTYMIKFFLVNLLWYWCGSPHWQRNSW